MLTGAALATALGCLYLIGPPPALRIDALWVNDHRREVTLIVAALGVALAATPAGLLSGRRRVPLLVLWLGAIALALGCVAERVVIIGRVLLDHAM